MEDSRIAKMRKRAAETISSEREHHSKFVANQICIMAAGQGRGSHSDPDR